VEEFTSLMDVIPLWKASFSLFRSAREDVKYGYAKSGHSMDITTVRLYNAGLSFIYIKVGSHFTVQWGVRILCFENRR
jgi:hypothetical protein